MADDGAALDLLQPARPANGAARVALPLQLAVLAVALAGCGALAALPISAGYFAWAGFFRGYFWFALVAAAGSLAVQQSPPELVERVQLGALAATLLAARFLATGFAAFGYLALLAALALAIRALPLERRGVRLLTIGALTASFALLHRAPPLLILPAMGLLQQALLAVDGLREPARRTLARCFRALLLPQWQPTPVPIEDLEQRDLGQRNFASGALWLFAGPALYQLCSFAIERNALPDPVGDWLAGRVLLASGHALVYGAFLLLFVFSVLVADGATARLLGFGVRLPMREPWKATNFMEYWRRANTWIHHFMTTVYFRNLFPPRGRIFPVGVLAVFLITAWIKSSISGSGFDPGSYVRWAIDGALVAATGWVLQRQTRSRVKRYVAGQGAPRRRWPAVVAATLAVFLLHGTLVEFSWPLDHDPVRALRAAIEPLFRR